MPNQIPMLNDYVLYISDMGIEFDIGAWDHAGRRIRLLANLIGYLTLDIGNWDLVIIWDLLNHG
jgi:hypothetical protein